MPLPFRLNARLGLLACTLALNIAVPVIEAAVAPAPAEARAGGSYGGGSRSSFSGSRSSGFSSSRRSSSHSSRRYSGGSGGVDGITAFFSIVFLLLGGFVMLALLSKANERGNQLRAALFRPPANLDRLLAEAAAQDRVWREDAILQHARDAFEAVQRAWVARNQDLASDYMTDALYRSHKAQTDAMKARGELNVLNQLEITNARVIHMADRLDDAEDTVWIQFTARAEDYLISEHTGRVLKGTKGHMSVFKEIWKFRRDGRTWKLEQIDTNAAQALPHSYRDQAA